MNLMDELVRWDEESVPVTDGHEGFVCDTLERAVWAGEKLAHLRKQQQDIHEVASAKINKLEAWAVQEESKLDAHATYFEGLLAGYMRQQHAADPKRKSLTLPDCVLKLRQQPAQYTHDDAALLVWAKASAAQCVQTVERLDWAALKKQLAPQEDGSAVDTGTGEVVPGVTVTQGSVAFSVEITE